MAGKHISYSEWRNWHICPHYHKLTYIDKVAQFEGNIYTAFGKALHTLCEETLTKTEQYRSQEKITTLLKEQFVKELKALPADEQQRAANDFDLPLWMAHGIEIIPDLYRSLVEKFGKLGEDWHVLAAEEFLYEPISEFQDAEKKFKEELDEYCEDLVNRAPIALSQVKKIIHQGLEMSLEDSLLLEQKAFDVTMNSKDAARAMRSLLNAQENIENEIKFEWKGE